MPIAFEEYPGQVPILMWTQPDTIEEAAMGQLHNTAAMPWVYPHVAVMPDVHFGYGATVGSVIPMRGAVAPSAVGVDIGCGMAAVRTSLTASDLPESLDMFRASVEATIPVGFNQRENTHGFAEQHRMFDAFTRLSPKVHDLEKRARNQLGTLGGGNHFIELCLDEEDRVWLFLHSGSRNIGKSLADVHIAVAKDLEHNQGLPDKDLAVFLSGTPEMDAYRHDLSWAQDYAKNNRALMLWEYKKVVKTFFPHVQFGDTINCHHNYVSEEHHYGEDVLVTRKGAISARDGELGLIPGSMGTRSYVVRGKGNAESLHSASHGAGRVMSRTKARKTYSVEDLIAQTEGVNCRKDAAVIDEIPAAYKDIDKVMANQADLVDVVHTLRQVMCVKG